jgi:hypothetical protein
MNMTKFFKKSQEIICLSSLLICLNPSISHAKTYHWVDEQGKTHFSDTIPPDQAKLQRETLNKTGQVVETISKAKTKEEFDQEQHTQALREEQENLIAKQAAEDRVLLSTYRSVEDMNLTLNGRMQALDAQRLVAEGNLKRLQKQLEAQQKKAAENERNGRAVPKGLVDDIHSSEQQIQLSINEINSHITKKNQIKTEFEANIDRFKFLVKSRNPEQNTQDDSIKIEALEGLYNCPDTEQCDKAWIRSVDFVKRFSTTKINNLTDQLIISNDPTKETDISLSVSKMQANNGQQKLFLDLRCHHSRIGAELCASKEAADIRTAFKPYLERVR